MAEVPPREIPAGWNPAGSQRGLDAARRLLRSRGRRGRPLGSSAPYFEQARPDGPQPINHARFDDRLRELDRIIESGRGDARPPRVR